MFVKFKDFWNADYGSYLSGKNYLLNSLNKPSWFYSIFNNADSSGLQKSTLNYFNNSLNFWPSVVYDFEIDDDYPDMSEDTYTDSDTTDQTTERKDSSSMSESSETGQSVANFATNLLDNGDGTYKSIPATEIQEMMEADGYNFDEGAWCGDFAAYLQAQIYGRDNIPGDFMNTCNYCNVGDICDWAMENDIYTEDVSEVKPGDLITYDRQHVGTVVKVNDDGTVDTVEGNTSNDSDTEFNEGYDNTPDGNPGWCSYHHNVTGQYVLLSKLNEEEAIANNYDETQQTDDIDSVNDTDNENDDGVIGKRNYTFDFTENLTEYQQSDLELFKNNYIENVDKYKEVEEATGVPAELVAAIHWSESGGDFTTYLHNGDPLGEPTTHYPDGIYFGEDQWSEAAIDAINSQDTSIIDPNDVDTLYEFAERYNGLGYRNRGIASPYVWSGTTNYTGGKYVADGEFDPNAYDQTNGVAVMLKAIC